MGTRLPVLYFDDDVLCEWALIPGDKYYLGCLQGKKWVDDVRVCLMKKLHHLLSHPTLTCNKLNEVAFKVRSLITSVKSFQTALKFESGVFFNKGCIMSSYNFLLKTFVLCYSCNENAACSTVVRHTEFIFTFYNNKYTNASKQAVQKYCFICLI